MLSLCWLHSLENIDGYFHINNLWLIQWLITFLLSSSTPNINQNYLSTLSTSCWNINSSLIALWIISVILIKPFNILSVFCTFASILLINSFVIIGYCFIFYFICCYTYFYFFFNWFYFGSDFIRLRIDAFAIIERDF